MNVTLLDFDGIAIDYTQTTLSTIMASSTTVGAGAGASDDGSAGVRHRGGGASAAGVDSQRDLLTESRQANAQSHLRRPTCLQRVRFFIGTTLVSVMPGCVRVLT